jgi:hypothetical protein
MKENNSGKRRLWRITFGVIAVVFIAVMWVKKDIITILANASGEQFAPLIATTIVVLLSKVVAIIGMALMVKWVTEDLKIT